MMSNYGFQIRKLILSGSGLPPAEIAFTDGLNIIVGPSDTGKTFILQCINHALGSSTPPDKIPESAGYNVITLELISNSNTLASYTIQRTIGESTCSVTDANNKKKSLKSRHSARRTDTISYFLLNLTGLLDKRIRVDDQGRTGFLSYRYISHLTVISEQNIIHTGSPLLPERYKRTTLKSVFKLLLSGIDDSNLPIITIDPKISKAKIDARIELIEAMVGQIEEEIKKEGLNDNIEEIKEQLDKINISYIEVSEQLSQSGQDLSNMEDKRKSVALEIRRIENQLISVKGLSVRFELLSEQYTSDLRRLEIIGETGIRLGHLGASKCPVCGSLPEHQEHKHLIDDSNREIIESSEVELKRIHALIKDLDSTREETEKEEKLLSSEQECLKIQALNIQNFIENALQPKVKGNVDKLNDIASLRQRVQKNLDLLERIQNLESTANQIKKDKVTISSDEFDTLSDECFQAYALSVRSRLDAWNFPELGEVIFDKNEWDVSISGRSRSSFGKGIRAVTHTAVILGLLRYCLDNDRPHPGFAIIDSPLVVYRQPESNDDKLSDNVKDSFFTDLASTFMDAQVIIFENEEPPTNFTNKDKVNICRFTKNNTGRYGFIPND